MFLFSLYLQEYQKLLYTNVQGKVNTYPKMKSKYLEWKALYHVKTCKYWSAEIVRAAILKCSKKKLFLSLQEKRGGDQSYPDVQLAAWNVTEARLHHWQFSIVFLKWQLSSHLWNSYTQLLVELTCPLHGNTSTIIIAMGC